MALRKPVNSILSSVYWVVTPVSAEIQQTFNISNDAMTLTRIYQFLVAISCSVCSFCDFYRTHTNNLVSLDSLHLFTEIYCQFVTSGR